MLGIFSHLTKKRKKHQKTWEKTFSPKVLVSVGFKANNHGVCPPPVKDTAVDAAAALLPHKMFDRPITEDGRVLFTQGVNPVITP